MLVFLNADKTQAEKLIEFLRRRNRPSFKV